MKDLFQVFIYRICFVDTATTEIYTLSLHDALPISVIENLKQILQLADFVKFAKYQPLPDENELSLMNSYLFVNQTKEEEKLVIPEENKENEENEENEKNEVNEKMK